MISSGRDSFGSGSRSWGIHICTGSATPLKYTGEGRGEVLDKKRLVCNIGERGYSERRGLFITYKTIVTKLYHFSSSCNSNTIE